MPVEPFQREPLLQQRDAGAVKRTLRFDVVADAVPRPSRPLGKAVSDATRPTLRIFCAHSRLCGLDLDGVPSCCCQW
jgi:hypothetical protein